MLHLYKLRNFFTRPKTTIVLFVALLCSLLIGELLPQTSIRDAAYYTKLSQASPQLYWIIDKLSLHSFQVSIWFFLLTLTLTISLALTLWQQLTTLLLTSKRTDNLPNHFTSPPVATIYSHHPDNISSQLQTALSQFGYSRSKHQSDGRNNYLIVTKHQFAKWGSPLLHCGLLLLILAAFYGFLFHSRGFVQAIEGETISGNPPAWLELETGILAQPLTPDFAFRLQDLTIDYWPDLTRKRIASHLTIRYPNLPATDLSVSLGDPKTIDGITITQTSHFGYSINLILRKPGYPGIPTSFLVNSTSAPAIQPTVTDDFPLTDFTFELVLYPDSAAPSPTLNNPEVGLTVTGNNSIQYIGTLIPGQKVSFNGYDLYCQSITYWSGITLLDGYGLPLVYTSFFFIFSGIVLLYLFVPRKIYFLLETKSETEYSLSISSGNQTISALFRHELSTISSTIQTLASHLNGQFPLTP